MRYQRAPLGTGAALDTIEGLSIFKPPYSRVTAIDLNTGEHRWMAPVGDGPRDHPLLKGLNVPPLGERLQMISVLVTKTLVFASVIPVSNRTAGEPPTTVGSLSTCSTKHPGRCCTRLSSTPSPPRHR